MPDIQILELIGYIGSVIVAISLMMSSIVKLRIINFIGGAVFSAYGFMIGALPVGFLNLFIALVDVYYLIEIFSVKEYFKILEVRPSSYYLQYFIDFHKEDIKKFMPSFSCSPTEQTNVFFILRNSIPAGLVCAEGYTENEVFVKLDFAIPGYRDFKMGKYVFNKTFKDKGIKKIYSDPGNKAHEKYLKRMGFEQIQLDGKKVYSLKIS